MPEKRLLIKSHSNPFFLFKIWFEEATQKEINDPNAMNLSTISADNCPNSRMVLLKGFDSNGFIFYTNSKSKKGISIKQNPNVALNFHWKSLLRQIRIEGKAIEVSTKESNEYFNTRPKESKIGAWTSHQSKNLKSRKFLIDEFKKMKKEFKDKTIKRPSFWKGFRVEPILIEFWQDMPFRLHDRVEYKKINNKWSKRRLYP